MSPSKKIMCTICGGTKWKYNGPAFKDVRSITTFYRPIICTGCGCTQYTETFWIEEARAAAANGASHDRHQI